MAGANTTLPLWITVAAAVAPAAMKASSSSRIGSERAPTLTP
jgi:hypothetical protein